MYSVPGIYKLGEKSTSDNGQGDKGEFIPFACTASQHYYGQTLRWEGDGNNYTSRDQDYVRKSGVRPHIYIARKSHAIYFRPSDFKVAEGWLPEYDDENIQYVEPCSGFPGSISDLGYDYTEENQRTTSGTEIISLSSNPIINNWQGHWGETPAEYEADDHFGPRSPAYRGSDEIGGPILIQRDPIRFHNDYIKQGQEDIELGGE